MLGKLSKKIFACLAAFAVISALVTAVIPVAAAGSAGPWEMTLSTPSGSPLGTIANGATFDVVINANTVDGQFRSWQADLTFDPAAAQVKTINFMGVDYVDATPGALMATWAAANGNAIDTLQSTTFSNTQGYIHSIGQALRVNTGGNSTGGPSGSGVLMTIHFQAVTTVNDFSSIRLSTVKTPPDLLGCLFGEPVVSQGLVDRPITNTPAPLVMTIGIPNAHPVAVNDSYQATEDIPLTVNAASGVLANDTDSTIPADTLTAVIVTPPTHAASFTLNTNGSFNYTPAANWNGVDNFTYNANDGHHNSDAPATVTITVGQANDNPIANDVPVSAILEDKTTPTSITLSFTDVDQTVGVPQNKNYSIVPGNVSNAHGTLVWPSEVGGYTHAFIVTYVPDANFNGSATFTYQVQDNASGLSNFATVTVPVTAVNDAPSFTKGADQTVLENSANPKTVAGWATAISAGPTDEAGQTLNFVVTNNNNALFSVQPAISAAGILTYSTAVNASGSAIVTVALHDNGGTANGGVDTSAAQTFNINVTFVNQPPVLNPIGPKTGYAGVALTFTISGSDVETANPTFSMTDNNTPATTATFNAVTKTFSWTPAQADARTTPYSFTFTITDGGTPALSRSETVLVTVLSGNVPVDGTKGAYLTFTAPDGSILWNFAQKAADQKQAIKFMSVDCNTPWTLNIKAMTGAAAGHMTKWNINTGAYDTSVSLRSPLQIIATNAPDLNGLNGRTVLLANDNIMLASAAMDDYDTTQTYLWNYNVVFNQTVRYSDPGLPAGYQYHVVVMFTTVPSGY
jgi:VCBS repeat-containing protein